MRTIVIGDVHGCYDELEELIDKILPTPWDRLISLGDITDKGPKQVECIRLLASYGFELVASNHDDKYCKLLRNNAPVNKVSDKNKADTYSRLLNDDFAARYILEKFAYIAGKDFVCIHGGVTKQTDLKNIDGKTYNEILRARWVNADTGEFVALKKVNGEYVPETSNVVPWQRMYDGRYGTIIHGHNIVNFPTIWRLDKNTNIVNPIEVKDPMYLGKINNEIYAISLDTGCYKGGQITALIIDEENNFSFIKQKARKVYST